jgi:hypothetical protein
MNQSLRAMNVDKIVIFYENSFDSTIVETLCNSLEYLINLGYNTICIDKSSTDTSLDDAILQEVDYSLKISSYLKYFLDKTSDKYNKLLNLYNTSGANINLLTRIKKLGLNFEPLSSTELNSDINNADELIATNIDIAQKKHRGNVIVVISSNYPKVQDYLVQKGYENTISFYRNKYSSSLSNPLINYEPNKARIIDVEVSQTFNSVTAILQGLMNYV